ncbi:hypothetical protein OCU04_012687 [Sclerotinia nivalis]|uniref:HTH CENPB-type domain-containing protein n=1 Tax=Sclerotinia nivalis TaxID=352851 RepID=A0A9X0DDI3_9HELO|nr:hypothetical protein OCU04_012687 [Sclerotinia nivalis]
MDGYSDDMPPEARMELALAQIKGVEHPKYTQIANFFKINRSTLSRRHRGKTTSRSTAYAETHQSLSKEQEEALIDQINKLTQRSMLPISCIVKNLAEEIIGRSLGKNWTANFVKRHKTRLQSRYLRCIDNLRVKADNVAMFEHFYDLV